MADKFKPYFKATTTKKNGTITWTWEPGEEEKWKNYLNSLQFKDATAKIKLTVERYRNDASTQQHRYLWGVIYVCLGEYFGLDAYEYNREIHQPLKAMFLGYKKVTQRTAYKIFGKTMNVVESDVVELVSASDLDTAEMTTYIDNVRRWALKEHNIDIPAPNEVDMENIPHSSRD
jgi:hypothetical protein